MKIICSIISLFFLTLVCTACNENPKNDDPNSTMTPGNSSNPDTSLNANGKDSVSTEINTNGPTTPPAQSDGSAPVISHTTR